jgi:hypothetical protein
MGRLTFLLPIRLAEPATTLTDYAMAVEMLLFGVLLLRFGWVERFWAAAFACVGIAAVLGGTFHGLAEQLSHSQQLGFWQGTIIALAWASFWPLMAVAWPCKGGMRFSVIVLGVSKLVCALALMDYTWGFSVRVADYLSTLGIVVLCYSLQENRTSSGLAWMVAGVIISLVAALILASPDLPWIPVSSAAIYHLVQMVALYSLYQGIRRNALVSN